MTNVAFSVESAPYRQWQECNQARQENGTISDSIWHNKSVKQ